MKWTPRLVHISVCVVIGVVVASLTRIHWLAASLWCSAVLFAIGSIAYLEDSQPGGFDNPSGDRSPLGAGYILQSLGITVALALAGLAAQQWLGHHAS